MSNPVIERVRGLVGEGRMTRAGLARAAGLHANSLRDCGETGWNPTSETLAKLDRFLRENDDRPALVGIDEIIDEARNGRMFVLVDDEDRENEGDLVIPAQMATPDAINFMAMHGRGLICLALTSRRVADLRLHPMTQNNHTQHGTAFTISIEAREGVSTGISAADRARTIAVAIDNARRHEDIVSPGHVFPLVARDGGVLVRAGHTEAAVDIARLAGLNPSGVICEIMNDDGSMARLDDLMRFARRHNLKIGTIRDLIEYRRRHDHLVERVEVTSFISDHGGEWRLITYRNTIDGTVSHALQKGEITRAEPTLVRMHTLSLLDDVLGRAGSGKRSVQRAMEVIGERGAGVIVVLRQPAPQPTGRPATEGDFRTYGIGAQILSDLGVHAMTLLTNSHRNVVAIEGYGLANRRRASNPGVAFLAKFLIIEARYYDHLNDQLIAGAQARLAQAGHTAEVVTVPGALEIPAALVLASEGGAYAGYIALGVVIRGETYHFEIVAGESARGIMALTMDGLAIGNGILTVENEQQALNRANPAQKDKGGEAAAAAIALYELQQRFGR